MNNIKIIAETSAICEYPIDESPNLMLIELTPVHLDKLKLLSGICKDHHLQSVEYPSYREISSGYWTSELSTEDIDEKKPLSEEFSRVMKMFDDGDINDESGYIDIIITDSTFRFQFIPKHMGDTDLVRTPPISFDNIKGNTIAIYAQFSETNFELEQANGAQNG